MKQQIAIRGRDTSEVLVETYGGYVKLEVGLSPERGIAALTPAEARELSILLADAAHEAEQPNG
jgi:hypothetical protein